MNKIQYLQYWLIYAVILFSSCTPSSTPDEKPKVAATIFPVVSLIQEIVGDSIEVISILPPQDSCHGFSPTPQKIMQASNAKIYFKIGAGLDDWVHIGTSETKIVILSKGCNLISVQWKKLVDGIEEDEHSEKEGSPNHNHSDSEGDPHLWLDPVLVEEKWLPSIKTALVESFPDHKKIIDERCQILSEKLRALNQEIEAKLRPFHSQKIVTMHSAFIYFARRYGLDVAAVLEPWPGKEPGPRYMAALIDLLKRLKVRVIFVEPQLDKNKARSIVSDIGGRVAVLDPLGGPGIEGRSSYIELLRYNTETLKKSLENR